MKISGLLAAAWLSALLVACGGGGGGNAGAGEPPPTGTVYPLQAAFISSRSDTASRPFSGSGVISGVSVTLSGSIAAQAMRPVTFEGRAAQARDSAMAGTIVIGGASQPLISVSTEFLGMDLMPLGMANGEYDVINGTANIPQGVLVGDTGTMYSYTRYADASKAVQLGSGSAQYAIQAGTGGNAALQIITTDTTPGGSPATIVQTFSLSPQGTLTPLSEELTGPSEHLFLQYGNPL